MRTDEIDELVQSTADPAFAVDGMQCITVWNKAAESFFGLGRVEVIGQRCSIVMEGYDECGVFCKDDCSVLKASRDRKPIKSFDLRLNTKQGKKWCNISSVSVKENKSLERQTVFIVRPTDVSKRLEVLMKDFLVNETDLCADQASVLMTNTKSPSREVKLSPREIEVLKLLAKGSSTADIASGLFISPTTVNNHVQHILKKLNSHTRLEAIRRAEKAGLI